MASFFQPCGLLRITVQCLIIHTLYTLLMPEVMKALLHLSKDVKTQACSSCTIKYIAKAVLRQ